jgi:hypothetical protein
MMRDVPVELSCSNRCGANKVLYVIPVTYRLIAIVNGS